jgi:hypothetical protein
VGTSVGVHFFLRNHSVSANLNHVMGRKIALIAVILVSAVSLLVQLQKAPRVEADFEVAGIAHDNRIPFKVHLRNVGSASAQNLSIVATAGEALENFDAPTLAPGEETTVEGELVLLDDASSVEFSARVLGERVSYRSETVVVARPEGLGGDRLYSQVQQFPKTPAPKPQQMGTSLPDLPDSEPDVAFGTLEEVEPETDVGHLISRVEQYRCNASQHTLEVYQQMGNQKADEFLVSKL